MYRITEVAGSKAAGAYVLATISGGTVYVSGQIALTAEGLAKGGIEAETRLVMENLGKILKAANVSFGDVTKSTIYLNDRDDFRTVNQIFASYFPGGKYGARETTVADLLFGAGVEISMIAKQPLYIRINWALRSLFNRLPTNILRESDYKKR